MFFFTAMPKWIQTPEDLTTSIGESIAMKCIATGSPKPVISWRKYSGIQNIFFSKFNVNQSFGFYIPMQYMSHEVAI